VGAIDLPIDQHTLITAGIFHEPLRIDGPCSQSRVIRMNLPEGVRQPVVLPLSSGRVPLNAVRPAEVRSRIIVRSNSANEATICIIMRPAGEVVSMLSVSERKPAPTAAIRSMICSRSFRAA
jgi:hypothetical protein